MFSMTLFFVRVYWGDANCMYAAAGKFTDCNYEYTRLLGLSPGHRHRLGYV